MFLNALIKLVRPVERKIFNINETFGIKILTRLRLGFNHMCKHTFRHTLNPFSTNVLLLHPLKTSENLRFSDVFMGYRSGILVENELRTH